VREKILHQPISNVELCHSLQAFPCGDAIDLENGIPAMLVADDVDAGVIHIESPDGILRKSAKPEVFELHRFAMSALMDVVQPGYPASFHGCHGLSRDHEDPKVMRCITGVNIPLKVENAIVIRKTV
jgi:hypothetical protein